MKEKNKKTIILLIFAFMGWALCGATMGIGMGTTTMDNALIIHAAAAPLIFTALSLVYFLKYNYTTPIYTALFFTAFVIIVDFFLVGLLINRSLDMFTSLLGTWIPFALIFTSTYITGLLIKGNQETAL